LLSWVCPSKTSRDWAGIALSNVSWGGNAAAAGGAEWDIVAPAVAAAMLLAATTGCGLLICCHTSRCLAAIQLLSYATALVKQG